MHLELEPRLSIAEVQGLFHYFFPGLTIQLFEKKNAACHLSSTRFMPTGSRLLKDYQVDRQLPEKFVVSGQTRIAELQEYFAAMYKLAVRIVRNAAGGACEMPASAYLETRR